MLHQLHMWDRESLTTFLATYMGGMMGHIAQTLAVSPSLSEKQLEDRLSVKSIALGAFQRTGMSGLIPMLVDTSLMPFGIRGFNSRTTSQPTDIFANPTTGLLDDTREAISAIARPWVENRQMSKAEVKAIVRPIIWQNTLPVLYLLGLMSQGRPEFAPKSQGAH
ncbi:hypothetical protein MWN34_13040 [Ancylobacter sp. 6x-1]|uniref:DUF937 domain-containing protein n=1 Tax=Ancylobacter crimeensis TaxID=2579147 RepID=A0ABT0DD02_9HYPH|nr:hypothetical protein [Ancylobacter crimeensis]MCK0197834.1 hypothetical protein [Ancylobacter crimeensis]